MPWKNGGGSTTEIAVEALPGGGFTWRLSMADLTQSGAFSTFPGIARIIVPLAGPAFRLDHGANGSHALSPLTPYAFSGDWATTSELTGPGRDYNVMIQRQAGAAWVEVMTLAEGASFRRSYRKGLVIVTAIASDATLVMGSETVALKPFETVLANAPGNVTYTSATGAHLIVTMLSLSGHATI